MAKTTAPQFDPTNFNTRPDWLPEEDFEIPKDGTFGPRVKLIQGISPEVDPTSGKFIAAARAGDIVVVGGMNEALEIRNFGQALEFVPVAMRKSWSEFVPRKQGGGFVALYTSEADLKAGYTPGNEVSLSIDALIHVDGVDQPVLLQFNTPTKLKPARLFAAALEKFKTLHGMVFALKASSEKNRQQQQYYNYSITPVRWTDKDTLGLVKALSEGDTLFLSPTAGKDREAEY
jgi:hypothetical protein